MKIQDIEKDKKQILEKLNELDDEISAINIDFNHNNTLLEEENKKLAPLRDKKMESTAKVQKLNLRSIITIFLRKIGMNWRKYSRTA